MHNDVILSEWHAVSLEVMMSFNIHRFFGDEASANNGGYRAAAYVIELRSRESGTTGFLLPPDQVRVHILYYLDVHVGLHTRICVLTIPFILPLPDLYGGSHVCGWTPPPDVWCVGSCDYHKTFFP